MFLVAIPLTAISLIALCALVGGLAFEVLVLRHDKTEPLRADTQSVRLRWLQGWTIAMMALTLLALSTGLPTWIVIVRVLMGGGILLLLQRQSQPSERWRALAVGVLLLQTQGFVGHSAHLPEPVMPILTDWFHLTLAAVWLGGVGLLARLLWAVWRNPDRERVVAISSALARFSPIAMFCVLGLAISGIVLASQFMRSFEDLVQTRYGITLSIKLILVAGLVAFGAFHQQVIMPRLQRAVLRGKPVDGIAVGPTVAQLRTSLLLEGGMGILLLVVVGVLVRLALPS